MFDIKNIKDPTFIKQLNKKELDALASDIRDFIVENVSQTGGHLASNLGVVELTIAMHYVFDSPKDEFIFDVGHQCYTHKILTGRAKDFSTLRQTGGLSGYINRAESEHDIWESGHSSTSISAQAGIIFSQEHTHDDGRIIALIGDTAIANGIAFEGLNMLGQFQNKNPIIILNDNKMGITKSVGALTRALNRRRGTKGYRKMHQGLIKVLPKWLTRFGHHLKRGIKGMIQQDNIFEDLGFDYYGPYEGNNIKDIISILEHAKSSKVPCLIHVVTEKGHGYEPATLNKVSFHGVGPFDPATGKFEEDYTYSNVVADQLLKIRKQQDLVVINPATLEGSKLLEFKKEYPFDCFDVGIAEEHAAIMAAGFALKKVPVVLSMYSTFSQRSYDQLLNDISRQNLKVLLTLDRCGIVGADGSTHQGIYDVAMLSMMPHMKIAMARSEEELKGLITYGLAQDGPMAIRYPKGKAKVTEDEVLITDESWEVVKTGSKGVVITYGQDLTRILNIVNNNNLDLTVVNARFIRPYDETFMSSLKEGTKVFIYEQVVESGSLGQKLKSIYTNLDIITMSIDNDLVIPHGKVSELLDIYHMGDSDILSIINKF